MRLMRVKNSRIYRKKEKEHKEQVTTDIKQQHKKEREIEYLKEQVKFCKKQLSEAANREQTYVQREQHIIAREHEEKMRIKLNDKVIADLKSLLSKKSSGIDAKRSSKATQKANVTLTRVEKMTAEKHQQEMR